MEIMKVIYTGKEKETGLIFDTNDAEQARKAGMYDEKRKYEPSVMIVGENELIKGFDKALEKMKPGESKTVEITPEEGYGERKSEFVKMIPLSAFKNSDVNPAPGMMIQLDNGLVGKIRFVSGGRVSIDLNHELAGKTLLFDIKLVEKIQKEEEQIKALFERIFPGTDPSKVAVKKSEKETEITLPKECLKMQKYEARKLQLIKDIKKYLKIENIKITEQY